MFKWFDTILSSLVLEITLNHGGWWGVSCNPCIWVICVMLKIGCFQLFKAFYAILLTHRYNRYLNIGKLTSRLSFQLRLSRETSVAEKVLHYALHSIACLPHAIPWPMPFSISFNSKALSRKYFFICVFLLCALVGFSETVSLGYTFEFSRTLYLPHKLLNWAEIAVIFSFMDVHVLAVRSVDIHGSECLRPSSVAHVFQQWS